MKRLKHRFYQDLHAIRDKYGEVEYDRDEILPAAMALLRSELDDDQALLRDAANAILDSFDKSDDTATKGIFPYLTHVALGEKKRIKRGAMEDGHLDRRKDLIDRNHESQNVAWAQETTWLRVAREALKDAPADTKIRDVIPDPNEEEGEADG